MSRHIAFLRGINVGGHRIKMHLLREFFEELGFDDVTTFIASGNVVFTARSLDVEALRKRIEAHLAHRLGYDVPTFIRSPAELEAIAAHSGSTPLGGDESGLSLYVIFLPDPASHDLRSRFGALESAMDDFQFSGREVYWRIRGKLTESPLFGGGIEKATRTVPTTTRNMTTLRRLVAKFSAEG